MPSSSPARMLSNPYLYLYTFGSFSNGLFISLRCPIIPELASRVGAASPASLGAYLGIGGVSGGIFAVPTGLLLDKADPHAVFAAGCVLRALSVGAMPLCTAIWQVNALAVAQGATLPMIGVSIRVCLVRVFHERCAAALNFTMGAFGLASIVAPLAFAALDASMPSGKGKFIFIIVWAIRMTSCFVYRVRRHLCRVRGVLRPVSPRRFRREDAAAGGWGRWSRAWNRRRRARGRDTPAGER